MKKVGISLALDGLPGVRAFELTEKLHRWVRAIKIHDLVDRYGPIVLKKLQFAGAKDLWVDYKVHDTPDTVALRVKALIENGAKIITVHASGGVKMMQSAVSATIDENGKTQAEIFAITILTSLDDDDIRRIYGKDRTREQIFHDLALMAKEAGIRTIVCSALEVEMLKRSEDLSEMKSMVPGTRSLGVALGQQKRSATPKEAVDWGADDLVAGTQVTKAKDPVVAFKAMADEIGMEIQD